MSKNTLKKALAGFGEPELRQLILDIYSKSKDAKELLDFYAEPDLDRKLDEYEQLADKEVFRRSRHAYRPRASKIRSLIRKFLLLEPGDEYVGRLMVHISIALMRAGAADFLPQNVNDQAIKFIGETISFLRSRKIFDEHHPRLSKAAGEMKTRFGIYRNPLKSSVMNLLEENEASLH